ncbi:hypothetical protein TARUN_8794 [Trichoderma arundinaceum]|uniref:Uncharacterized protein n=1 Tax=Trichoderma arundinaceum TaxID=490622 RepID=A0A395NCC5_TRIAR|nr:hypothetical protein TARUN_8794 [Trichoderma arundinaceum]
MLAAHREQENRVLSHQVPSKQQPKTPGMRYPKTPMELGRGNENALAGFAAKSTLQGAVNLGENRTFISKKHLTTPTGSRMRAPLGNKTTNAKARNLQVQGIGGKDAVKGIEKSEIKNTTAQKRKQIQRQRQAELAPKNLIFQLRDGQDPDQDEPEYAPPNPQPLPYQSDVFPRSGLTFKGLSKENLLKGYYEHFYNPVDGNGMSRVEKQLKEEMKSTIEEAIKRNDRDTEEFTWNNADVPDELEISERMNRQRKKPVVTAEKPIQDPSLRPPALSTRTTRSALSIKPLAAASQESLESHIITRSTRQRTATSLKEAPPPSTTAHTRGSSSSLVFRTREDGALNQPAHAPAGAADQLHPKEYEIAAAPDHDIQNAFNDEVASDALAHLQYPVDSDCEDLPLFGMPYQDEEDEEVFELRLDI